VYHGRVVLVELVLEGQVTDMEKGSLYQRDQDNRGDYIIIHGVVFWQSDALRRLICVVMIVYLSAMSAGITIATNVTSAWIARWKK